MATTLAANFTLISCVRGSLYGDIWNLVWSVCVGETLNCEREVKNPQNLYAVGLKKYGTTVGHILRVISRSCTLFFNKAWWSHRSTLTGCTAATVLIPKTCHREVQADCIDCDILFGEELCLFHLNQQHKFFVRSHVARRKKCKNFG